MLVDDVIPLSVAALIFISFLHKVHQYHKNPTNLLLWKVRFVTYTTMTVAVALGSPTAYVELDNLIGVPNASRLIKHICGITAFTCGQIFLHTVSKPETAARGAKIRIGFIGALLAAMSAIFLSVPLDVSEPENFFGRFSSVPGMGAYMLLFIITVTFSVTDMFIMSIHYARVASSRLLRVGTLLMACGSGLGVIYAINLLLSILNSRYSLGLPMTEGASKFLVPLGAMLFMVGLLIPAAGPHIATLYRWPRRSRSYQALHPLWLAIYRTTPSVVLTPPKDPENNRRPWLFNAHHLLIRRTIEIRDGALELRAYITPEMTATAEQVADEHGLTHHERAATVAACRLAVAIAIAQHDPRSVATETTEDSPFASLGADDVDTDAESLVPVAVAFAGSPLVAEVLRRNPPENAIHV
jgi:hypothetical protein